MSSIKNNSELFISSESILEKLLSNKYSKLIVFFALIVISILLYYRDGFFYFWDEWDLLYGLSTNNFFDWSIIPHNEHLIPFYKLSWGILVTTFKENFGIIVLINCIIVGINSFLVLVLLQLNGISRTTSTILSLFYLISLPSFSMICFTMCLSLSVLFILLSIIFVFKYNSDKRYFWLLFSAVSAFLSPGFFNLTILMPAFLFILILLLNKDNRKSFSIRHALLTFGITFLLISGFYFFLALNVINSHSNLLSLKWDELIKYWLNFMFASPLYYFLPVDLLKEWFPILMNVQIRTVIIPLLFSILICWIVINIYKKSTENGQKTLFIGIIFLFICSILISISRHKFGAGAAYAPRYHTYVLIASSLILGLWFKFCWQKFKFDRLKKTIIATIILILLAGNMTSIFHQQSEILMRDKKTIERYSEIKSNNDIEGSSTFKTEAHPDITVDKIRKIILFLNS